MIDARFISEMDAILSSLGTRLGPHERNSAAEFTAVGEYDVAIDIVCSQLYEFDVDVSSRERAALAALVRLRGLDELEYPILEARVGPIRAGLCWPL
jgi:hypothetical protein